MEGVTFQQVLESYGDSRASEASRTAVLGYEKKHGLKDGVKVKKEDDDEPDDDPDSSNKKKKPEPEDMPAWAKTLLEQNKALTERLNTMDKEKTGKSRSQKLSKVLEELPEGLRKGYERISFDALSDEDFDKTLAFPPFYTSGTKLQARRLRHSKGYNKHPSFSAEF